MAKHNQHSVIQAIIFQSSECQNFIFMSSLIHMVDFSRANVNLRVSKWFASYPGNSISQNKYTIYKCLAHYFNHHSS